MEETIAVPPPVPPKNKLRPATQQESAYSTVPSNGTTAESPKNGQSDARGAKNHVVKILISPQIGRGTTKTLVNSDSTTKTLVNSDNTTKTTVNGDKDVVGDTSPCIRISLNGDQSDMVLKNNMDRGPEVGSNYFYYGGFNFGVMTSGQVSPSDTLDSGTCSDLDGTPPPAQVKKKNGVSVTLIGSHKRAPSSSSGAEIDSDDNESNISCDSLNSGKISPLTTTPAPSKSSFLPSTLLQDIRKRVPKSSSPPPKVDEKSYEERKKEAEEKQEDVIIDTDMFYNFHMNEHVNDSAVPEVDSVVENETFAGYRDIMGDGAATIRSAKGTVRGVKNRVRAGIATFLQINSTGKNYKEKEAGKVVVYTTTMGILRETYQACMKVKQILRLLLIKFEERDVFMSSEYQAEIQERMRCDHILVPQVFVDGLHVGDADTIERLNETGELRRILKPFKSMDVCTTCKVCGGFRLLPCQICKGSKKSVHRNHFTAEFVALKCMNCDEVGLVRCHSCS